LRSAMTPEKEKAYRDGLAASLRAGYAVLKDGGAALDAVTAAVVSMENDPMFNAGIGAVFTHSGGHEQDSCIMDGRTRDAGAAAALKHVKHPILLARKILEHSPHVLLAGSGAEDFASVHGLELVEESFFDTAFRREQFDLAIAKEQQDEQTVTMLDHSDDAGKKMSTVGAVAVDRQGKLAAATSSGGITNKRAGRIGDTPIIGAGTYADNNTCAVSATGVGEYIMRGVVAYDIAALMEHKGMGLVEATELVVMHRFKDLGGEGGVIAIDSAGNIAMPFNSRGMYRGFMLADGTMKCAIYDDEENA